MDKLRKEVYESDKPIAKLEKKFDLDFVPEQSTESKLTYLGHYPLEPPQEDGRGTYGGEFIAQGLNAAWKSITQPDFHPHSLHAYFVKAGTTESPIKWEVIKVSDSRTFSNRMVMGYQSHNDRLVFTLQCSFIKNNHHTKREEEYNQIIKSGEEAKNIPFTFKRTPNHIFYKYKDNIDTLLYMEHTHDNVAHAMPRDLLEHNKSVNLDTSGNREFGIFVKVLDDYKLGQNFSKQSHMGLAFASDSLWLATVIKAIGLPLTSDNGYFRVSLDHSLYFYDGEFDSSDWIFIDYRFVNMMNNRILAVLNFFDMNGKPIACAVQEAYAFFPKEIAEASWELHEREKMRKNGLTANL
ncbi:uncharacterized protein J8A68_000498 [[Candida] subhashii]|uniref:Uncharacterized protein n=1 Tax=[Candida] subhashii TaxID=561895 RepID=A0A8J5R6P7_9ASCO|nr:uncharacterized protein J8A68_000498 [[Candida] subhashii]KAG7665875.1 hypothetical protein J8A68_000498 [[Candida] subhashii]